MRSSAAVAVLRRTSYLLVFAVRHRRHGAYGINRPGASTRETPVRSGTVMGALSAIGQGLTELGVLDPRYPKDSSKLDPVLQSFKSRMEALDAPSVTR